MKSVLVGFPILKDARRFHVRKGRRWTVVEHMLLEALAKQDWTIGGLVEASNLPRRVVIEVLIRLMRAGWVELNASTGAVIFVTTPLGRLYAAQPELPPATRPDARFISYTVELLTGSVFRIRDLAPATKDQWRRRASGRPALLISGSGAVAEVPDVRQLADTLLEPDEELIRVDFQDWRPRHRTGIVLVRGDEIDGLGGSPSEALRETILSAARKAERQTSFTTPATLTVPRTGFNRTLGSRTLTYRSDDLILGGRDHEEALEQAISRARHRLIIHSTFININTARETIERLKLPIKRGALVDILWGQSSERDEVNSTRRAASDLDDWLQAQGLSDRVRVHQVSTRSHAKILLFDVGEPDRFAAIVGSCNWLSSGLTSFDASIRLRDPGIVADVAFELSELPRPLDGQVPDLTAEMVRLGRRLEARTTAPTSGRPFARVVIGPDHARVLLEARDQAKERIVIMSHRLGANAKPVLKPLAAAAQANHVAPQVYYGRVTGKVTGVGASEQILQSREDGIEIRAVHRPRLHAKVLAWDDDDVVITSLNWLSADPSETDPRQEIGIHIHGPGVARRIIEVFSNAREFAAVGDGDRT